MLGFLGELVVLEKKDFNSGGPPITTSVKDRSNPNSNNTNSPLIYNGLKNFSYHRSFYFYYRFLIEIAF
jgi:hypothetical protein